MVDIITLKIVGALTSFYVFDDFKSMKYHALDIDQSSVVFLHFLWKCIWEIQFLNLFSCRYCYWAFWAMLWNSGVCWGNWHFTETVSLTKSWDPWPRSVKACDLYYQEYFVLSSAVAGVDWYPSSCWNHLPRTAEVCVSPGKLMP